MALENASSEVSKKVKSAIKAKLIELGVYVDDELPDYIMILVGNKKTKDQMDNDLSLFLGHNTEQFNSWLHSVLQKLNAASMLHKDKTKEKERRKEEEKEKPELEPTKALAHPIIEEKKRHKKKKDKSEKKKEKKEKKKKKDKEKEKHGKSQKTKEKVRSESKSKSPTLEEAQTGNRSTNVPESSENIIHKVQQRDVVESSSLDRVVVRVPTQDAHPAHSGNTSPKDDDDVPDDVVNLRPNAEDLALGLEEEFTMKKQATREVSSGIQPLQLQNIEVKVDSSGTKEVATKPIIDVSQQELTTSGTTVLGSTATVHERLGTQSSMPPLSTSKRIINLREESSFPPKAALHASGEGMGRVISNAIASAVKSVAVAAPSKSTTDGKTGKKLEARVRPLFSSRRNEAEQEGTNDVPAVSASRVVSTVGAVLKRSHSEDPEDNEEPLSKRMGVVSKIEVTPRPRRSGAMQANTALILRAVADAHKSVNKPNRKALDEKEEDKGRKELFTRSYHERQNQRLSASNDGKSIKKFAITVPNALLKDSVEKQIVGNSTVGEAHLEELEMEEDQGSEESLHAVGDSKCAENKVASQQKTSGTTRIVPMQVDDDPAGSTRFIVTLDGLATNETPTTGDLRSRLSGRPLRTPSVDEEEYIEEVEEWEEVEEMEGVSSQGEIVQDSISPPSGGAGNSFAPKWKSKIDVTGLVAKKEERCRYWPACKEGASCQYIHPAKFCNTFPSCRFGDKCIYIHPNCRFDSACTKPNCPYTHPGTRTFLAAAKSKILGPKSKIKCRYYPKCVDMACPFLHPKQICRYGKACQTPSCFFVHPEVTTGALLKWIAPKQGSTASGGSVEERATTAPSSVSTTTPSLMSLNKTTSASVTAAV